MVAGIVLSVGLIALFVLVAERAVLREFTRELGHRHASFPGGLLRRRVSGEAIDQPLHVHSVE